MARPKRFPDVTYCADCGKAISDYRHQRCTDCFSKSRITAPRACLSCGESKPNGERFRGASGMCRKCQYQIYGKEKRLRENQRRLAEKAIMNCLECGKKSHREKGFLNGVCHKCVVSINNKKRRTSVTLACPVCQESFEVQQHKIRNAKNTDNLFCSKKCYGKYCQENITGAKVPNWRGGAVKYYGPNWKQQQRLCRKRANYICQNCGKTHIENRRAMDVHHIKPFKSFGYIPGQNDNYLLANDLSNLMALCRSCHLLLESRKGQGYNIETILKTEIQKHI